MVTRMTLTSWRISFHGVLRLARYFSHGFMKKYLRRRRNLSALSVRHDASTLSLMLLVTPAVSANIEVVCSTNDKHDGSSINLPTDNTRMQQLTDSTQLIPSHESVIFPAFRLGGSSRCKGWRVSFCLVFFSISAFIGQYMYNNRRVFVQQI